MALQKAADVTTQPVQGVTRPGATFHNSDSPSAKQVGSSLSSKEPYMPIILLNRDHFPTKESFEAALKAITKHVIEKNN